MTIVYVRDIKADLDQKFERQNPSNFTKKIQYSSFISVDVLPW